MPEGETMDRRTARCPFHPADGVPLLPDFAVAGKLTSVFRTGRTPFVLDDTWDPSGLADGRWLLSHLAALSECLGVSVGRPVTVEIAGRGLYLFHKE